MDKCQGVFGKLFGHSYRPAITRGAPNLSLKTPYASIGVIGDLMDKARPEIFHGIYCKRCGKVIDG